MASLWKKVVEKVPEIEEASSSGLELKSALKKVNFKVNFWFKYFEKALW